MHLVGVVICGCDRAPKLSTYQDSAVGGASGLQRSLSTRSEAVMTDDLNDDGLWEDWLRDDRPQRSSPSGQSSHNHRNTSSHPTITQQEQDFSWLGEHMENELCGPSHELDIPTVSEPQDDMSWLANDFNKAEEEDRKRRSLSRH